MTKCIGMFSGSKKGQFGIDLNVVGSVLRASSYSSTSLQMISSTACDWRRLWCYDSICFEGGNLVVPLCGQLDFKN
jgi:hypothetical protein